MSLVSLNRQRGTCKKNIAKCTNFLNTFQLSNDENADFIILNNKLSTVKEIIEELSQLKYSYFKLPDDADFKDALEVIIDLQEETQELEVRIQIILSQFKKSNSTNNNEIIKNKIKLPDLPLPTFSGKFQEFELFKTQFKNVIVNNHSLNNTQKLCYLRSALKNDASLILSDQDSFESLMETLINRYENKRALVDIHITEMLSMPKIQSENPVQLRFLIDTVRSHLRSLKNLRMDLNVLSDAILLHMLNSKIDRESQRQFQLNLKTTEVPSLQDFFSFLETRCIQLESIRKTDFDTKKRKEFVRNNHTCKRCLSPNHINNCPSSHSCIKCRSNNVNSMHNVLLCETKTPFIKEKIVSTLGSEKVLQPSNEKLTFEPNSRAIALASTQRSVAWGSEKGLHPTAVIYVNGHQGRLNLRCVFDSGSESSFLTLHAAERLGLDKIKTEFTVQGLNNSSAKINYLARASVSNSDGTFNLNVNMFLTTEIIKIHPSK
ncbi:integrase catalytic domain-containing protein [Trichonephila inaurata madagascariensis]|uniref:Integrase catalytic domain-containing protein n=1 Tax=Trichonephila inaurata madagascariensis TaxID=2747483 RepID=A0A8X6Y174_9ARAC|nr:integrase catalytic domain-containing protein [Trichonephila inaurata madagascariensis]